MPNIKYYSKFFFYILGLAFLLCGMKNLLGLNDLREWGYRQSRSRNPIWRVFSVVECIWWKQSARPCLHAAFLMVMALVHTVIMGRWCASTGF